LSDDGGQPAIFGGVFLRHRVVIMPPSESAHQNCVENRRNYRDVGRRSAGPLTSDDDFPAAEAASSMNAGG